MKTFHPEMITIGEGDEARWAFVIDPYYEPREGSEYLNFIPVLGAIYQHISSGCIGICRRSEDGELDGVFEPGDYYVEWIGKKPSPATSVWMSSSTRRWRLVIPTQLYPPEMWDSFADL